MSKRTWISSTANVFRPYGTSAQIHLILGTNDHDEKSQCLARGRPATQSHDRAVRRTSTVGQAPAPQSRFTALGQMVLFWSRIPNEEIRIKAECRKGPAPIILQIADRADGSKYGTRLMDSGRMGIERWDIGTNANTGYDSLRRKPESNNIARGRECIHLAPCTHSTSRRTSMCWLH